MSKPYRDSSLEALHLVDAKIQEVAANHPQASILTWRLESAPFGLALDVWLETDDGKEIRRSHLLEPKEGPSATELTERETYLLRNAILSYIFDLEDAEAKFGECQGGVEWRERLQLMVALKMKLQRIYGWEEV